MRSHRSRACSRSRSWVRSRWGLTNRGLDRQLMSPSLSGQVREELAQARGKFAAEFTLQGEDRKVAQDIVRRSLGRSISLVLWLAALLALLAAFCAWLTIRPE